MSTKTLLIALMGTTLFAAPAFAQDAEMAPEPTAPATMETDFTSSDLDQDGLLTKDEFITFAVMRAEAGDQEFTDLVSEGSYDVHFAAKDADADAKLDRTELGGVVDEAVEEDDEMAKPEIY